MHVTSFSTRGKLYSTMTSSLTGNFLNESACHGVRKFFLLAQNYADMYIKPMHFQHNNEFTYSKCHIPENTVYVALQAVQMTLGVTEAIVD